jgi:cytochrome b
MTRRGRVEEKVVVWDWPARITHWGFSFSLTAALVLGYQFDPESPWFRWHIPVAYFAAWFLGVRLLLGFAGSRYMRWAAFFHSRLSTVRYFGSVFRGERNLELGLNPGSAAFALGIYACLAALIYSGFDGNLVETWHARLASVAVGLIGLHLVGLVLHGVRHRAATPLAMVHGRVSGRPPDGLAGTHAGAGALLFLLSGLVLGLLVRYYDEANGVIAIPCLPEIPVPVIQKG